MPTEFQRLEDLDIKGKRVLLRVDLNVPIKQGTVKDGTRITRIIPTIRYLQKQQAKIILLSHFGRPTDGFSRALSLAPLTNALSEYLDNQEIKFAIDCIGKGVSETVNALEPGDILLLENVRFHKEELTNDPAFVKKLAALGDIYVNDTFSCSHRKHASITGLANALPSAAGKLLQSEIEALNNYLESPKKPLAAIIGGSKVSSKLALLESLLDKVDILIIGGAMANSFLLAQGYSIGTSLHEASLVAKAKEIIAEAAKHHCNLLLPVDAVVAPNLTADTCCKIVSVDSIPDDQMILDLGPQTIHNICDTLASAKTIVWNGPLGAFETSPFDVGSITLARFVAKKTREEGCLSIAGGGDVTAALNRAGLVEEFSYISTGGGAFLEWMEGKSLPGIAALSKKTNSMGPETQNQTSQRL